MITPENGKRPILKLPLKPVEVVCEIIAAASLIYMIVILVYDWTSIPETVPHHFGISGKADAWGNKRTLWNLPIVTLALYVFLSVINRFPHMFNYPVTITKENAAIQYRTARSCLTALKAEIVLFFTYIQWMSIHNKLSLDHIFSSIFLVVISGTLGYFIYRSYKLK